MKHVPRLRLARLPTPLERLDRLSSRLGVDLWIKRDDLTGGVETGNKLRKLEYLLAEARGQGADTLVTCGGIQSNHARATAAVAARLGMRSVLVLRTADPAADPGFEGNVLLDRLLGARLVLITPGEWKDRTARMDAVAEDERRAGRKPYVIPEGGSNALGALGYVHAAEEIAGQLAVAGGPFDTIAYACGSGGTGAGLILGAKAHLGGARCVGFAVCDDAPYFEGAIGRIAAEASERFGLPRLANVDVDVEIDDRYKGVGYALSRPEELGRIRDVAREEGIVLDPVYTGKAFHGLLSEIEKSRFAYGRRVLFVHTGGLYGLFPKAGELATVLG